MVVERSYKYPNSHVGGEKYKYKHDGIMRIYIQQLR